MTSKAARRARTLQPADVQAEVETRSAAIRRALEEDIFNGTLKPGDHLNELALSERFSASRTPIREALRQLEAEDLVRIVPRKGAFVARISLQHLLEMFEMMSEIESACARLATERMSVQEKEALIDLHNQYQQLSVSPKDAEAYFEASSGFHRQIYAGTHNQALEALANSTYDRLLAYRRKQLDHGHRSPQSFEEHTLILEAILRGDAQAAADAMRDHSGKVRGNALDVLRALTS
ncbi:MAG: GntR family transcriptional regulator [Pseudomonadota bacterium]